MNTPPINFEPLPAAAGSAHERLPKGMSKPYWVDMEAATLWFVYVLMNHDRSEVLYVGSTGHIAARIRSHKKSGVIDFHKVSYCEFKTRSGAMNTERRLIAHWRPKYNVMSNPVVPIRRILRRHKEQNAASTTSVAD